ncbi:hypothetical protein [Paraburkholderia azotifigens]|uniref:NERD domain-containing protein n=1 Tax=Paraburkholderia azotifigens TaxID=2057004 RepID=A0ABU9RG74_9BURK
MNFLLAYQRRQLPSPLNVQDFDETNWTKEFERLGSDDVDADLHRAGLMVHKRCQQLWSMRYLPESGLNDLTKIRALLAVSNHSAHAVINQMRIAFEDGHEAGQTTVPLNRLNLKLETRGGHFSPDEILQAAEVGARTSIGEILRARGNRSLSGNATFKKVDWGNLLVEFNLGAQFDGLREQWDDFVWNGYRIEEEPEATLIAPRDDDWIIRNRVSSRRFDSLLMQFFHNSIENFKNWPDRILLAAAPRSVRQVVRRDGRYRIDISDEKDSDRGGAIRWLATTSYAQEPYYEELLNRPRKLLDGGTVDELISAWTVLQSVSHKLFEFQSVGRDDDEPHSWIGGYVPVLEAASVARAISEATRVPLKRATSIVRFFTYNGEYRHELYGHPLIPIGRDVVSPCLAAIHSPNILRLTDVWLRELGEELEQRGPAFERYIRSCVTSSAAESPLLSESTSVLPDALNFTVPGHRSEEIDLVAVVGSLVLLGEVKCMLQPTESQETARHRERLIQAATQITRKAESVKRNPGGFREQLRARGVECPEGFEVLSLVILNNPIHVGYPVDGVPVVDEHILNVFFRGALENALVLTESGELKLVKSLPIYKDVMGIADSARSYFSAAPQLDFLKRGVARRRMPIFSLEDGDQPWLYVTVECIPHVDPEVFDETLEATNG